MILTAFPVGFFAGLFGIGGGLITVPFLFFIFSSLDINLKRSAIGCKKPSNLPAYKGPTRKLILARNLRSKRIITVATSAAVVNPGKTTTLKKIQKIILNSTKI